MSTELLEDSNSPILSLYADIWSLVLGILDIRSIERLMVAGYSRFEPLFRSLVRKGSYEGIMHILDLDRFMRSCRRFEHIEDVAIIPENLLTRTPSLIEDRVLPKKLVSLELAFKRSADLFLLQSNLREMVPDLLHLRIQGSSSSIISFDAIQFPPRLQTFELSGDLIVRVHPGDIAKLPRSLLKLRLLATTWPQMDEYEWPIGLSSLALHCSDTSVLLESLPRTVSSLTFDRSISLTTEFRAPNADNSGNDFPWRVFFPNLSHLDWPRRHSYDSSTFLRSLVLERAFDETLVRDFLSSGPFDLPSLRSATTYPTYSFLRLPPTGLGGLDVDEFRALSPHFQKTDLRGYHWPNATTGSIPSTQACVLSEETTLETKLPPKLTRLYGSSLQTKILPPTLTSIFCEALVPESESTEKEGGIDHFKLPRNLLNLQITGNDFPVSLASFLPVSLTRLDTCFDSLEIWTLVATRLIHLQTLNVHLGPSWSCYEPLTPIASSHLQKLSINIPITSLLPSIRPPLWEFFSDPSPLPQSLTSLGVHSHHMSPIPTCIIPALPRQLLSVSLNSITLEPPLVRFPESIGISAEDCLRHFPPQLRALALYSIPEPRINANFDLLTSLPSSLTSFRHAFVFGFPPLSRLYSGELGEIEEPRGPLDRTKLTKMAVATRLPPNLSVIMFAGITGIRSMYLSLVQNE